MKDLLSELIQARDRTLTGVTGEAREHIRKALDIMNDVSEGCGISKRSLPLVRAYVKDVHFLLKNGRRLRAVESLSLAVKEIESKPEGI